MPSRPNEDSPKSPSVAERVRSILESCRLSLYRVSQQSAALYGQSSPYFVPHNLYYDLRNAKFTPSIYQIFTLSLTSGYRFEDWLRVFGFDLRDITRLQVRLPAKRTILLDTSLCTRHELVPWVRNRRPSETIPAIAPLIQFLELSQARTISSVSQGPQRFLYGKIGSEDAIAFPELVPGSIVRMNPDADAEFFRLKPSVISDRLFLIEHSKGFYCSRIRSLGNGVIVPVDNGLSYAQIELRVPIEAKIRGYVDLEFRLLLDVESPHIPRDLARRWRPQPLRSTQSFGQLLKNGRGRLHMSTREVAAMSRQIAALERDGRYESSSSSISDYEVRDTPPRDVHKIFALCSIYGLRFASVMEAIGMEAEKAGGKPIPDRYFPRRAALLPTQAFEGDVSGGIVARLMNAFQNQLPLFLGDSLDYFAGSARVSLEDFFWVGGDDDPLHPYLVNGFLAIVNRRKKTPTHFPSKPLWQQPIYLFLARDGRYRAACCGIENDKLVVHPYGPSFHRSAEYRYHQDAEIVGQIVAIARRFP